MDSEPKREASTTPAHCPACGRPNGCRLESGEAYKGPCWCERVTVSGAAMRRISAELPEARCICGACMEAIAANPDITLAELSAGGCVKGA